MCVKCFTMKLVSTTFWLVCISFVKDNFFLLYMNALTYLSGSLCSKIFNPNCTYTVFLIHFLNKIILN